MRQHPDADRHEITVQAKWGTECMPLTAGLAQVTVADVGNFLDKARVYVTRGRRNPEKHIKSVLKAMHEIPAIQQGTHYNGEIMLTAKGNPCNNNHNKMIALTANGTFTLTGLLITDPARAQFLNRMWDVMQTLYQTFAQMKAAFDAYHADRSHQKLSRTDGMRTFLQEASAAMEITADMANKSTLNKAHKKGYEAFFRGQGATQAMRKAKLLKKHEKAGVVHRVFSLHGLIADEFRLSTMAQAISIQQPQIAALPSAMAKRQRVMDTIDDCNAYFVTHGTFDIPGATKNQQTLSFVERERIVRRRTG